MPEPIVITFLIPPPLVDKVRTAAAGICEPGQLAERVFLAWLNGGKTPRRLRPPSWRASIVQRWREARERGKKAGHSLVSSDRVFLANLRRHEGVRVSRGVLFKWASRFEQGGVDALTDRWVGHPKDWSADPFMQEIRRLAELPSRLSLAECHRRAAETAKAAGWETRSYKVAQRFMHRVKGQKRSSEWPATGVRTAIDRV